ncbi:TIGR01777 family oxidoreductase [Alkalihalobacillus sp. AL-G]|uniref:TIGR01777 family oxidoreductase n=1 Tax=Alkalihalobacillus sp. AL-G TaxID=2926399 RepID=UPI00272A3577|nr:TIGR01777 family oxidoreductase [Alkalihalobacillus sp. AL-G]WLD93969.1 TIGR01777 family oxidoreductase [Alkalihalobacillus sp. AL-G]
MNIAITGGTGFVGQALTDHLTRQGYSVYVLTRNPEDKPDKNNVTYIKWLTDDSDPSTELPDLSAIVNLAGETINGRWTEEKKEKIISSRITATQEIVNIIAAQPNKPSVLINASAIGFYGTSMTRTFDETVQEPGNDFLSHVTENWEREAAKAKAFGVRVVYTRFGLILDGDEGALPRIAIPYKIFAGGPIGSGEQWYSWIHINDIVGLIDFAINNETVDGPLNATSPHPVQMHVFGKVLGKTLNRPHWFPTPGFLLRGALGEMSTLILDGQKVYPQKALNDGYKFQFPTLTSALNAIYNK